LYFTEPLTVLDKKIIEAFMVFDHTSSNTVDVREVGTIIRSLGKLILLVETFRYTKYLHRNGPSPWKQRIDSRKVHAGYEVDKVVVEQVFL